MVRIENTLTSAETALLGILAEEAMYPYQIEKLVEYIDMRFWTDLSMSTIYKVLRKLEKKGLVQKDNEITEEDRLRKRYSITQKGVEALRDQLLRLLETPEHMRWQIDLANYYLHLVPTSIAVASLEKYRNAIVVKISGYRDLLACLREEGCPPYRFAIAKRPIHLLESELVWLDSFLEGLKNDFSEEQPEND